MIRSIYLEDAFDSYKVNASTDDFMSLSETEKKTAFVKISGASIIDKIYFEEDRIIALIEGYSGEFEKDITETVKRITSYRYFYKKDQTI